MRLIAQGINNDFSSEILVPGGRKVAWRALPGILRARNDDTGTCDVTLVNAITSEPQPSISLTGNTGKSGAEFLIPGAYRVFVENVVLPINVTIWMDGDTGIASAGVPGSGFDDGFDIGFGG